MFKVLNMMHEVMFRVLSYLFCTVLYNVLTVQVHKHTINTVHDDQPMLYDIHTVMLTVISNCAVRMSLSLEHIFK